MMSTLSSLKPISMLTIMCFFCHYENVAAQENGQATISSFSITLERTEKGLKLNCTKGCAWKDLEFTTVSHRPYAIDQNGMTFIEEHSFSKESELSEFLFTVMEGNNQLNLNGIKGTAWTNLQFSLPKNRMQSINPYGMVN